MNTNDKKLDYGYKTYNIEDHTEYQYTSKGENQFKSEFPSIPTQQTINRTSTYDLQSNNQTNQTTKLNNYQYETKPYETYTTNRFTTETGILNTQAERSRSPNPKQNTTYLNNQYQINRTPKELIPPQSYTSYAPGTTFYPQTITQKQTQVLPSSPVLKTSQVKEGQIIKGQSRIQYIPFEKKIVDYEVRQWIQKVPVQRTVIQYQQKRYVEQVPRQVTKIDYYAVEYLREYVPQVVPEKIIEMVPVERIVQRTEYIPIQKQIVHYPQNSNSNLAGQSRIVYQGPPTTNAQKIQGQSRIIYQQTLGNTQNFSTTGLSHQNVNYQSSPYLSPNSQQFTFNSLLTNNQNNQQQQFSNQKTITQTLQQQPQIKTSLVQEVQNLQNNQYGISRDNNQYTINANNQKVQTDLKPQLINNQYTYSPVSSLGQYQQIQNSYTYNKSSIPSTTINNTQEFIRQQALSNNRSQESYNKYNNYQYEQFQRQQQQPSSQQQINQRTNYRVDNLFHDDKI